MLRRADVLTVKDGDPSLAGAQDSRTSSPTENNPLDIPSPEFNPDINIPIPPSSLQNVVEAPDFTPHPSREAPREEEVIVTAPRPKQQNIRNPLQGAINNYYRAYARRRAFNAILNQQIAASVNARSGWNDFIQASYIGAATPLLLMGGASVGGTFGIGSVSVGMSGDVLLRSSLGLPLSAASTITSGAASIAAGAASGRLAVMGGGSLAAKWTWTARGELAAYGAGNVISNSAGF